MSIIYNTRLTAIPADQLGKPAANNPVIVDQANLTLYEFTLNTDIMTYKFPIPIDYKDGDILFYVVWTNDGGVDDQNKFAKWQLDYQVGTEGDVIDGSHGNSPKSVEDEYLSASGWVEHHTEYMTIEAADFTGKTCIYLKLSAVTPAGTALTCSPHLLGICFLYNLAINKV